MITGLVIVNQEGNKVYELKAREAAVSCRSGEREAEKPTDSTEEKAAAIRKELERTGVALDAVLERYGVGSIREMEDAIFRKALNSLKKTKGRVA